MTLLFWEGIFDLSISHSADRAAKLRYFAIQMFFGSVKKPAFARATARQAPRFASATLFRDTNILRLGEEAQRFFAAFAAHAALFHAAEGNAQVAQEPAIHPHGAGVNFLSNAMGAVEILGPNT